MRKPPGKSEWKSKKKKKKNAKVAENQVEIKTEPASSSPETSFQAGPSSAANRPYVAGGAVLVASAAEGFDQQALVAVCASSIKTSLLPFTVRNGIPHCGCLLITRQNPRLCSRQVSPLQGKLRHSSFLSSPAPALAGVNGSRQGAPDRQEV